MKSKPNHTNSHAFNNYNKDCHCDDCLKITLKKRNTPKFKKIHNLKRAIIKFRERRKIIPKDPEIIHEKAREIRLKLLSDKEYRIEMGRLKDDLDLIKLDARIKNLYNDPDLDNYDKKRNEMDSKELTD